MGVLYGPSGCGKSSLVKAGLLPRLAGQVLTVNVEATADDTETRLLRGLHKGCPDLADDLGLTETIAAARQSRRINAPDAAGLALRDQYHGSLTVRHPSGDPQLNLVVTELLLFDLPLARSGFQVQALLGRDILARCEFQYFGSQGRFQLCY